MAGWQSIVVGFDGSDGSVRAVDSAIELAKEFGSSITLLSVVAVGPTLGIGVPAPPIDLAALEKWSHDSLHAQKERIEKAGIGKVEVETRVGSPTEEILKFLGKAAPDLMIVGRKSRSIATHLFLGSVADAVVHHANCPVLVVPPPEPSSK